MRNRSTRSRLAAWSAGLAVLSLVAAACTSGTTATVAPTVAPTEAPSVAPSAEPSVANKILKMAVIAPETGNDFGWNQQGLDGAQAAADAVGRELIEVADGSGYDDPAPILAQLKEDGAQFIVAQASGYTHRGRQFAKDKTGIPVIVYRRSRTLTTPGLVADVATDSQEGGYLAGVLAATMTKTGTLGIVISADDTNWHKQAGGFVAGAQVGQPGRSSSCRRRSAPPATATPRVARRTTETVIAGGADIIFGMGDGSSFGMLQAVETATPPAGADKVWFIDVIGDKTSIDTKGVLLSSVLWDFEGTYPRRSRTSPRARSATRATPWTRRTAASRC